jgi:hypothetical protein
MRITFLYYEDCPSHDQAMARLQKVMAEEGLQADIEIIKVETEEQAKQLQFIGSPTIRVNGQDIDPPPAEAYYALTCRAYQLENGRISPLPSAKMIRNGLRPLLRNFHSRWRVPDT